MRLAVLALALMTLVLVRGPVLCAQEPTSAHEAASELAEESGHEPESVWPLIGKIFNFVALVGLLAYFLRGPLGEYLTSRRAQVRGDLESARALKAAAERQIAELDARLKALPGEIAELEARGRAEVVAEQQRLRDQAAAERQRLLDQATRDIEAQVRAARRELMELAADLAIGAAERRIAGGITEQDRARLVDQYVQQVGHE
jgi:F-type H+-transporting ATPase subunit b